MMKYIGTKMVEAEKALRIGGVICENNVEMGEMPEGNVEAGYRVRYPDGYESFSPKKVFEEAYLPVGEDHNCIQRGDCITEKMVEDFIADYFVTTLGDKTTVVRAILVNGFEIVESSSCVDPANYDEEVGKDICLAKIKDQVWYLLGFLLQTAKYGVKNISVVSKEAEEAENIAEDCEKDAAEEEPTENEFPRILVWQRGTKYGMDIPADMKLEDALDMMLLAFALRSIDNDKAAGLPDGTTFMILMAQSADRIAKKL